VNLPKPQTPQQLQVMPLLTGEAETEFAGADAEHGKRTTSRIPLENALSADIGEKTDSTTETGIGNEAQTKTIKIKRPTPKAAVTVMPPVSAGDTGEPSSSAAEEDAKSGLGKTARIELPPEAAQPEAQKRPIRLKRPGGDSVATPAPAAVETAPVPTEAESDLGVVSLLGALAAVLVLGVLLLCFGAQSGSGESGIPWPGKIEATNR